MAGLQSFRVEVDPECAYHCDALAAQFPTAEEIGFVAGKCISFNETDGVDPVVVSLHSDVVTEPGTDMEIIASADHARVFGIRHRSAPLWTVQFHPEIIVAHRANLIIDFGWESEQFSFEDVTAGQVFENVVRVAAEATT